MSDRYRHDQGKTTKEVTSIGNGFAKTSSQRESAGKVKKEPKQITKTKDIGPDAHWRNRNEPTIFTPIVVQLPAKSPGGGVVYVPDKPEPSTPTTQVPDASNTLILLLVGVTILHTLKRFIK